MPSSTLSSSVCLLFWITLHGVLAFRIDIKHLKSREQAVPQCPFDTYKPCGNGLEGDMCCDSDSTCLVTAANTTGICCPRGSDCTAIAPLSCNIDLQNWRVYPDATVMTMALHQSLPTCDDKCCPHGFVCVSGPDERGSTCQLDPDQIAYTTLMPKPSGFLEDSAVSVTFPVQKPISTLASSDSVSATPSAEGTSTEQSDPPSSEPAVESSSTLTTPPAGEPTWDPSNWGEEPPENSGSSKTVVVIACASMGAAAVFAAAILFYCCCVRERGRYSRRGPTPPPKPDSHFMSSKSTSYTSVAEIDSKTCLAELAAHPWNYPEVPGELLPNGFPFIPAPEGRAELPDTPVLKPVSVVPLSVWNKRDVGKYERPKSHRGQHDSP
ncbi:hypothetical protein VD0004_g9621 [Verticillium dahliae]|nr:hypothetical protein VD0004_g9621 [Verticillium dahliae]PNH74695.1 hypothetical protein VD0001_g2824 [Verticillium dahliae]